MLKLMGKKICTSLKVLFILTCVLYSFFRLGSLCHFLIVLLVGLRSIVVAFLSHTHLFVCFLLASFHEYAGRVVVWLLLMVPQVCLQFVIVVIS